jgi:hypothetical protein
VNNEKTLFRNQNQCGPAAIGMMTACAVWSVASACANSYSDDVNEDLASAVIMPGESPEEINVAAASAEWSSGVAAPNALCGRLPRLLCNTQVCLDNSPEYWPLSRGTPCTTSLGAGECDGGVVGPIYPEQLGVCVVPAATADPQYYVLSVIYAPPGHTGSSSLSSVVTYAGGSTLSAATEVTKSFKSATSVSATLSLVGTVNATFNGGYTKTLASTAGMTMTKTATTSVTSTGPPVDGINHDEDAILLWLNPRIHLGDADGSVRWTLAVNPAPPFNDSMDIQPVKMGWLKGTMPMPVGVRNELEARGITPAHYPSLLAYDEFATGRTTIDPSQFARTTTSFPYVPPSSPGGIPDSFQLSIMNSLVTSNSTTKTIEKSVGLSVSTGISWLTGKLNASQQWTWSTSNKNTSTNTSTETAAVTIKGPSFGYTGPTNMAVYYDTVYKTFMFQPIVVTAALRGKVVDGSVKPAVHQLVSLTVDGIEYRTITTRDGEYQFFDIPAGAGVLRVKNAERNVQIGNTTKQMNIAM